MIMPTDGKAKLHGLSHVKTDFLPNETYEILIDFDAEKSVVKQGKGKFNLKPVLKLESVNQI